MDRPPPPSLTEHAVDGLVFNSSFDHANLKGAERARDGAWDLTMAKDAENTSNEKRSSTWFYFRVRDEREGPKRQARFRFAGMARQGQLYKHGHRPVVRRMKDKAQLGGAKCWSTLTGSGGWKRLNNCSYRDQGDRTGDLQFDYMFTDKGDEVEFAFCFPYAYEESLATHREVLKRVTGDIVVYNELLCFSAEGRRIEMLTVTDNHGADKREEDLLYDHADVASTTHLFPEVRDGTSTRPPRYPEKAEVIISARVHPGETPASFVLDGLLELLLRPDDRRAKVLRRNYVFRFIPQLNPDGVHRGHYRHDSYGVNLNRVYWPSPDAEKAPAQAALMVLAKAASTRPKGLALFVDLHAHASKRGVFIYGNHLEDTEQHIENRLYALLLSVNSSHFDYHACNFSKEHMLRCDGPSAATPGASAEGSARVACMRYTGLARAYTLECNYNCGRLTNNVPKASGEGAQRGASPERPATITPEPFTPDSWREVGRALGASLLDVAGTNPWDRIRQSRYKNVQLARRFIEDQTVRKRAGAVALAVHSVARMSSLRTRKAARESTSTEDIRKLAADARRAVAAARPKEKEEVTLPRLPITKRGRKATSKVRAALRMNAANVGRATFVASRSR
jgi:hypothetical protein